MNDANLKGSNMRKDWKRVYESENESVFTYNGRFNSGIALQVKNGVYTAWNFAPTLVALHGLELEEIDADSLEHAMEIVESL